MKRLYGILILSMVVASLVGCDGGSSSSPVASEAFKQCEGSAITFGEISDNPNEVKASRQPFASYMAGRLASYGIECGRVEVVDSTEEMAELIKNGEVDVYMDSIYPAMLLSNATGAQPILRRWRNCDPEYYSVIFTSKDSGITSIEDLPGHTIAMDQIYSTSGFALPAVYLLDKGLNLVIKDSLDDPPKENEIGIYISKDDINTLYLVRDGNVSGGATDDYNLAKWQEEAPGTLVKLAETGALARQVVLVRSGLNADLQSAIKQEMSNAYLDPTGLSAMMLDAGTCKYDDPPLGIEATFSQMLEMHNKLIEIPGWQEATFKDQ